jgi:hypothetical protein
MKARDRPFPSVSCADWPPPGFASPALPRYPAVAATAAPTEPSLPTGAGQPAPALPAGPAPVPQTVPAPTPQPATATNVVAPTPPPPPCSAPATPGEPAPTPQASYEGWQTAAAPTRPVSAPAAARRLAQPLRHVLAQSSPVGGSPSGSKTAYSSTRFNGNGGGGGGSWGGRKQKGVGYEDDKVRLPTAGEHPSHLRVLCSGCTTAELPCTAVQCSAQPQPQPYVRLEYTQSAAHPHPTPQEWLVRDAKGCVKGPFPGEDLLQMLHDDKLPEGSWVGGAAAPRASRRLVDCRCSSCPPTRHRR